MTGMGRHTTLVNGHRGEDGAIAAAPVIAPFVIPVVVTLSLPRGPVSDLTHDQTLTEETAEAVRDSIDGDSPAEGGTGRRWHLPWHDRPVAAAALPVTAVAVIAGVVSYSHIVALALRAAQSTVDAHLFPFAVDGLIVGGSVILAAGSALGWLGVIPGVAATLFANLESGLPHGKLAAVVATWPAIAFSVASFMLERWLKTGRTEVPVNSRPPVQVTLAATPEVTPAPPVQVTPGPVSGQAPEVTSSQAPGHAPRPVSGHPEVTVPARLQVRSRRKVQVIPARISDADLKAEIRSLFEADRKVSVNAAAKSLGRSRDRVRPLLEQVRAEERL